MRKAKTPKINLADYRYTNAIPALEIIPSYALTSPIRRIDTKKKWNPNPNITELTALLGIDLEDKQLAKAIKTHQNRIGIYYIISSLVTALLYFSIGVFGLFFIFSLLFFTDLRNTAIPVLQKLSANIVLVVVLLVLYIVFRLADRIASVWIDRYYADTLAYSVCLKLLTHLMKEDSLMLASERQRILVRIRALRRYLILLPYQNSVTELNLTSWARSQFRQMENFIQNKENQIVAPLKDTRFKIIDELYSLLLILLTSQYGEFKYTGVTETDATSLSQATPARNRFLKFLSVISPILLLIANYFFKVQIQAIGFDNQIVALIALAWLLLALDANLNLGIVDRLTGLAKAMRDLR